MSFFSKVIKWVHDVFMGFEARIAKLEQHSGVEPAAPPTPAPPPQVMEHVAAMTPKAPSIDYSKFDSVAALQIRIGRGLTDAEIDVWMAAHPDKPDPRTHDVQGGSLASQPTGEAVVWGAQLDWNQNGSVRHQHARANEDVVFDFTIPDGVADGTEFWLASPIGPSGDGDTATKFTARVDGGEPSEILLTAVGGVTHNLVVGKDISRGAHRYILRFNGDRYDARAQLGGHS